MKIKALKDLPTTVQEFYSVVKTLKAKEARKEASKAEALASLIGFLGEDKSVLIVTQTGLAVCDVNPQAHAEFDRTDTCQEITAIIEAEKETKAANARLSAAIAAGKAAKKVTLKEGKSIRLEILSPDKVQDMHAKFGPNIRAIRNKKATLPYEKSS